MRQNKSKVSEQVKYDGRFIDKKYFRVFVYNGKEKKLADSYDEFEKLIASGLWFESKEGALASRETAKEKPRKANNGPTG